jgi:hypothetical protein
MVKRSFLPVSFLTAILTATFLIAFSALPAHAGDNTGYSYARIVRLSYVSGDVQIVRTDKGNNWEPASLNMPVQQGFALGTNNGRAEIELEHGSTIWLAENSVLQFTEMALSNGGRITRMTLSQGTATFDASLANGDVFEVSTPSFKITPPNKSQFRVDMFSEGGAVSALRGDLRISGLGPKFTDPNAEPTEVRRGETFAMNGKTAQSALKRNPANDEWDHWVSTRETAEVNGQNQALGYTNAPFTYGMGDMGMYGTWNYFPGFGYGWQPFGMAAGWAPFMAGQWMFYPSLGWSWVSSEPWGWVPYHFGGWQYSGAFGWMWMPGDYGTWTAAPVNWVSVGNRIGWTPRSAGTAPASTAVIVSTKALGKEGKNQLMSASEVAGKLTPLNSEPAANGKFIATSAQAGSSARAVVPTSANLGALRAGLATNSAASSPKVDVGAAHIAGPPQNFAFTNAAPAASRMPSRPPAQVTLTQGAGMPGFGMSASQSSSASSLHASTAAATSTAHPASGSTASAGKPH